MVVVSGGAGNAPGCGTAPGWEMLTYAERRVVELVVEGLTNPQIGARLSLSKWTVQAHLKRIFPRVGVATRSELAGKAARWPRDETGAAG